MDHAYARRYEVSDFSNESTKPDDSGTVLFVPDTPKVCKIGRGFVDFPFPIVVPYNPVVSSTQTRRRVWVPETTYIQARKCSRLRYGTKFEEQRRTIISAQMSEMTDNVKVLGCYRLTFVCCLYVVSFRMAMAVVSRVRRPARLAMGAGSVLKVV